MKVLITHVYSNDNKGDAAILSVLVGDIRQTFPKSNISILTFDKIRPGEQRESVPVHQSFMGLALTSPRFKPFKLPYSLYVIFATLLAAFLYRIGISLPLGRKLNQPFNLYRQADLVVGVGGGYLRGKPGLTSTIELILQLHPLFLSRLLNQKVVLYSQSIGPFGNRFQQWLATRALRHTGLIIAREDITAGLLKKLQIPQIVTRSVDAGFAFAATSPVDLHRQLSIPASKKIVGITVRKWLSTAQQESYERSVAALADFLVIQGYAVVFVPQVTSPTHNDDDRLASRDVYHHMTEHANVHLIERRLDHRAIKNLYAGLDLLVGTRFHSVIFSLTSCVPALAIEYEHKTSGIMQDLGLGHWVIKIEDVTAPKLIKLMQNLIAHEDNYRAKLQKSLPSYIAQARQTRQLLKDTIQ